MGWAIRRERVRYDTDDTGAPFGFVYASAPPLPEDPAEPYVDAWDYVVPPEVAWPAWVCECGTHNEGHEAACIYCGLVREDIDGCV